MSESGQKNTLTSFWMSTASASWSKYTTTIYVKWHVEKARKLRTCSSWITTETEGGNKTTVKIFK